MGQKHVRNSHKLYINSTVLSLSVVQSPKTYIDKHGHSSATAAVMSRPSRVGKHATKYKLYGVQGEPCLFKHVSPRDIQQGYLGDLVVYLFPGETICIKLSDMIRCQVFGKNGI